jgi:hypothetical protein
MEVRGKGKEQQVTLQAGTDNSGAVTGRCADDRSEADGGSGLREGGP